MVDIEYFKRRQKLIELRFNPYHDPSTGRFCSGGGGNSGLTNGEKKASLPTSSNAQYFKTRLSDDVKAKAQRKTGEIQLKAVENSQNNLYVSEKSELHKPKQLHEADMAVTKAISTLDIQDREKLPEIYIVSAEEMGSLNPGAYVPAKNQLFLQDNLFISPEKRKYIQQDGACPESEISTIVHELIHWQDAQKYQEKYGAIKTSEDYKIFSESLKKDSKKALDKIGITEYNVNEISSYASDMFQQNNFDEVYTEYRTQQVLRLKE